DDGYLMITDRIKHMIVSAGGKNIYPGPIEERFKGLTMIDQIVVIGERRDYLTALVVPNLDVLKQQAGEQGIAVASDEQLLAHPDVQKRPDAESRSHSRGAAAHARIRGFRPLSGPFTVENCFLTPSRKPRRRQI